MWRGGQGLKQSESPSDVDQILFLVVRIMYIMSNFLRRAEVPDSEMTNTDFPAGSRPLDCDLNKIACGVWHGAESAVLRLYMYDLFGEIPVT
jgi:hypothetical protein